MFSYNIFGNSFGGLNKEKKTAFQLVNVCIVDVPESYIGSKCSTMDRFKVPFVSFAGFSPRSGLGTIGLGSCAEALASESVDFDRLFPGGESSVDWACGAGLAGVSPLSVE